ncbi:MAG TPA: 3D domain-containing protein [Bryobacteraceae bacterium]|nr:3D domain-containing protein [Bryobacteraceae bacterium]
MKHRVWIALWFLLACQWCAAARTRPRPVRYRCEATAFSMHGKTQLGVHAQEGVVAADPRIFPLGTVVRISDAGPYSGSYVVTDTGSRIIGHRIDIFIASRLEARRFGRKRVSVHVLRWGDRAANRATP